MPGSWVSSSASRTSASARQELSSVSASEIRGDRARAGPLPGRAVGAGRGERSAAPLVGRVRRRQPRCLLEDRGRDRRGAAIVGQPRRVVEHLRDACIGRLLRERKMASAGDRVLDDLRDPRVDAPALVAEVAVQKRCEQRMGEADGVAFALDHVGLERGAERVRGDPGLDEQRLATWCPARRRSLALAGSPPEAPRRGRASARRASRAAAAAARGRRRPEARAPAPARRTGCRLIARGCGAASGAGTPARAGRAGAGEVRLRSAARRARSGRAPPAARARARTADPRRRRVARAGRRPESFRAAAARTRSRRPKTRRATGRRRWRRRPGRLRRSAATRRARRPRRRADRPDRLRPRPAEWRSRARASSAAAARAASPRGRLRAGHRARRTRASSPPRQVETRGRAGPAHAPARPRRARASTSRSPPRLPARARPARLAARRGTRRRRRALALWRRPRVPSRQKS